ncbi:hypothetical protein DV711_15285 [Motiliproteus coralliicola]|uniref:Excisionase n=1 Tax=Motiliproteus coralliicola TaxID=2283196 RepID=A0A369WAD5_9GAMM|nr:hypothetical protein [Motiliproteus coralliicola]RDE18970.1 hypothetical protein DV711_15285 [Motiliproteus coralliicola]
MKWKTIDKFSAESGMSKESIRALKKKGIWREKIHWIKAANGRIFINYLAVEAWIEGKPA